MDGGYTRSDLSKLFSCTGVTIYVHPSFWCQNISEIAFSTAAPIIANMVLQWPMLILPHLGGALARPVSQSARARGQCGYKLSVRTGPSSDAGTSARVYVTLKGSRGEVRRRRLTRGGRREFSFSSGSLERFRVHGKDVGELKQIMSKFID